MKRTLLILKILFCIAVVPINGVKASSTNAGAIDGPQNSDARATENEALPKPHRAAFIHANLSGIIAACRNKRDVVIKYREARILCYHGSIARDENLPEYRRKYSIVYLNSPGGSVKHSFDLGREIFRNGTFAIVDGHCHSSCGSYLLPSARRVYITDETAISMHTSLPRNRADFVKARHGQEYAEIQALRAAEGPNSEVIAKYLNLVAGYEKFFDEFVIAEMDYFKAINTDVAYASRYREVYRTLQRREDYVCKPNSGLYLIIGPKYLKEFNIKVIRGWFPEDKSTYVKLLPSSKIANAFIFDFDDHPFWLPDEGMVAADTCMNN